MNRVLIVDDDFEMLDMISEYLSIKGLEVKKAHCYNEAIKYIGDVDIILLDVMMPNINGFTICENIRDKVDCPIIFISARNFEEDIIKGLGVGGDDYIEKPFRIGELYARILSHLRRERRIVNKEKNILESGNIILDMRAKEVRCLGEILMLSRKEFDIIELLMINKGCVFSKEQIFQKVWEYDSESNLSTVVEHIKNIRGKLKEVDSKTSYIKTVWSVGYKWDVENV